MAINVQELIVKISGDSNGFKAALVDSTEATESFNTSLLGIAALATAAFAAVAAGAKYSLEQYKESEQASNRLSNSLQNQGLFSETLFNAYKKQSDELQRLTGIDNDAIITGQAQLQSMIGRVAITKEMSTAAVNLAAALGGSAKEGFEVLGRSIEGNTRGLKQLGIEIDQNLTKEERTKQILEKVSVAYGGLAESQNKGLGGVKGLGAAINDLAKDFGEVLAPNVGKAISWLTDFFNTVHDKNEKAKDPMHQLEVQIKDTTEAIRIMTAVGGSQNIFSIGKILDLKGALAEIEILKSKREELLKGTAPRGIGQDPEKLKAAIAEQNLRDAAQARETASLKAHQEEMKQQYAGHTREVLDLYKEEATLTAAIADDKNAAVRSDLRKHLETIRDIRKEAEKVEIDQVEEFSVEVAKVREDGFSISEAQAQVFNEREKQNLQAQVLTMETARTKAYSNEIQSRIKSHNTLLMEQQKFGKAYAMINQLMHSEVYQGSSKAAGELQQLQQSSNSTLKAIGKVAAVANITMKTAESAMNIFAGFSTIPIVGPALGLIGAAAAVAFGAEQVGTVLGAAEGGLVMGGIPGVDSVPMMAQRGELVAPAQNFEEVVSSVAAKRSAEGGGGGNTVEVIIGFQGEAAELLEKKFLARRATGVGVI